MLLAWSIRIEGVPKGNYHQKRKKKRKIEVQSGLTKIKKKALSKCILVSPSYVPLNSFVWLVYHPRILGHIRRGRTGRRDDGRLRGRGTRHKRNLVGDGPHSPRVPETYHFYKLFSPRTALSRPVSRSPSPSRLCAPITEHHDDDDGRSRFLRAGYLAIKLREPRTIARSRPIIAVQPHPHSIGSTSNGLS